jgi:hypothetical protein
MRITNAVFTAADPQRLAGWYEAQLGAIPTFVPGKATPHHFAFHVTSFEPWRQRLELSEEHDFSGWDGARAVYFRDPERNVVELITRPQPRAQLTLAEVGLPVADVANAVAALSELGLEPYREWDATFAPLGDADGLLIVVRAGRGWFPYDEPAGSAPIHVTIEGVQPGELELLPGSGHRVTSR